MANADSTLGSAIPEELAGVQSQLEQMMGSADDRTKRLIFERLFLALTEALPESDQFAIKNKPEPMPGDASNLFDAGEKLREAACLAEFVELIGVLPSSEITLHPAQLNGFYLVMRQAIERMQEAGALIDAVRTQPEALAA